LALYNALQANSNPQIAPMDREMITPRDLAQADELELVMSSNLPRSSNPTRQF